MKLKFGPAILKISLLAIIGTANLSLAQNITPPPDTTIPARDSVIYNPLEIAKANLAAADTVRKSLISINFDDSARAWFLPERRNLIAEIKRSFFHDAGDFLRSCPSNMIIENDLVPSRKTLSPFTVPGNRMNIIYSGRSLHPISHLPEPDDQIDFNDLPTAAVDGIYNIDGPLGLAFDGDNAISSLVMIPQSPDSNLPVSRAVIDKGAYGYANTMASFAGRWKNGMSFRGSVEYRKVSEIHNRVDDSYHQWGELLYPISPRIDLTLSGRLYHRAGDYLYRPDYYYSLLKRFRRDRDLSAGMIWCHSASSRSGFEFRHERSESRISILPGYFRNLDIINNGLSYSYETAIGSAMSKTKLVFSEGTYVDGSERDKRRNIAINSDLLLGNRHEALIACVRAEKSQGYDIAPTASINYSRTDEKFYLLAGIGYCTQIPSQYESGLRFKVGSLLNAGTYDYAESGSDSLVPEKQLVGNLTAGIGKTGSDLIISLTGGKIFDGIYWPMGQTVVEGTAVYSYMATNTDITFGTASAKKRFQLGDFVRSTIGASYHYLKIGAYTDPPYSPDYQLFGGVELHRYIDALGIHLFGYVETIYYGSYYGNLYGNLGEKPILNLKLSFQIKKFRFNYMYQNLPQSIYQSREDNNINYRFNYFSINWEFEN
jgi:hypothetical protein